MTLAQMEYFIAVAETGNVSKAAEKLFMTQPALSRQISAIEEELGMEIFYRKTRPISLTPAGRTLYEGLKDIIGVYKASVTKAKAQADGLEGILRFGVASGLEIGSFFPDIMKHFRDHYPSIEMDIDSAGFSELMDGLRDGKFDLVVTYDFDIEEMEHMHVLVLDTFENYMVVSRSIPIEEKESYKLEDFKELHFIVNAPEDTPGGYRNMLEDFRESGFEPKIKIADSPNQYMILVESGFGVTVLGEYSTLYGKHTLRFLPVEELKKNHMILVWSRNNQNPSIDKALDLFREIFPDAKESP